MEYTISSVIDDSCIKIISIKGLGKRLFIKCIEKAEEFGVEKIYISASSCENAQQFYEHIGSIPVVEINMELTKLEPYDIHMEYVLFP